MQPTTSAFAAEEGDRGCCRSNIGVEAEPGCWARSSPWSAMSMHGRVGGIGDLFDELRA
uniref:Uncharacterized protein n=1 Tax=Streptomyces sp. NBC_00119 TaxID=2975659 RepID=A0AAU1TZB6_9ACTN